jgi:TonB family protein
MGSRHRLHIGLAASLLLVPLLRAQHAVFVEHGSAFSVVRAMQGGRALVEENGKLVRATGTRYSLQAADAYAPLFISVRNVEAHTSVIETDTGAELNKDFHFRADLESPYGMEHVFLLLDLNTEDAGKMVFLWEVGTLVPRELRPIDLHVPIGQLLGEGHFRLHLFTNGLEVFHSQMPPDYIDHVLDKMVAKEIHDVRDAMPKPLVGPAPEYPPPLRKAKTAGRAIIRFTISPRGRVLDATVKNATEPAFGTAALEAMRQWRFLPKIKDGQPISSTAEMPFSFTPK